MHPYGRIIHLSHKAHPGIPLWPGDPPIRFADVASLEKNGFFLRKFSMGEHSATHANAPAAFHPGGASIDQFPADTLAAPAVVIDVRAQTAANPDYALTPEDVAAWEREHGRLPEGSAALLYTGWQDRWADPPRYFGRDHSGRPHFPGFGLEAARFLLLERGAAGLGIDTHGLEPGAADGFPVNSLALEKPRLALENLTNLHLLPPAGAFIVAGILRLAGGSGSPASVLAFLP